jgi:hypothetical protein
MTLSNLLPLGQPPREDVDAAAKLWLEYQRSGRLTADGARVFWQSVADPMAVAARADELSTAPAA